MDATQAITLIYAHFGTDEASGQFVGYCGPYFEALRNARTPLSRRASELLILKAEQLIREKANVSCELHENCAAVSV